MVNSKSCASVLCVCVYLLSLHRTRTSGSSRSWSRNWGGSRWKTAAMSTRAKTAPSRTLSRVTTPTPGPLHTHTHTHTQSCSAWRFPLGPQHSAINKRGLSKKQLTRQLSRLSDVCEARRLNDPPSPNMRRQLGPNPPTSGRGFPSFCSVMAL